MTATTTNSNKLWQDDYLYNTNNSNNAEFINSNNHSIRQSQQQQTSNMIPSNVVFDKEQQEGLALPTMARTLTNLLAMSMSTMNNMSSDNLRHHLCNAIDVIHDLVRSVDNTQAELDKVSVYFSLFCMWPRMVKTNL